MFNYQKLHYENYYITTETGDIRPCTRRECFSVSKDQPSCSVRQRWFYDPEAGYAIRLPRNKMGEVLGRRNQADLKAEERYSNHRKAMLSIDEPCDHEDEGDMGAINLPDDNACVEQIVEHRDNWSSWNRVIVQLPNHDRTLFRLLLQSTRKSQIAKRLNITEDGVRYRELQLRKRLLKNPDFQKLIENCEVF